MIKFWVNSVNGSAGQRSVCLLSPAIAQRTGVNKSVSFARWQQGAGFVVPHTTACVVYFVVRVVLHTIRLVTTTFECVQVTATTYPVMPCASVKCQYTISPV